MTPHTDPRGHFKLQCLLGLIAGAALLVVTVVWALLPMPTPPSIAMPLAIAVPPSPTAVKATVTTEPVEVALWRALVDRPAPPPPPPPPPPPVTFKVFSVFKRAGAYVAAIDPGNGSPLQYAKSGDQILGVQILAIDQQGVTVLNGDRRQRVELPR